MATSSPSPLVLVNKANTSLQQKSFQHTPTDFTIKRAEQREVETLALAEALGEWATNLLQDEGRVVRGAEGFFQDVADGVVLCKILQRLGIPVEKPRDPPKNEFESKENRQKFQKACARAKFRSVPQIDFAGDPTTGLIPALIECAAIDQAQSHRRHIPSTMPDAISKRTQNLAQSPAMRDAIEGNVVPQGISSAPNSEAPSVVETAAAAPAPVKRAPSSSSDASPSVIGPRKSATVPAPTVPQTTDHRRTASKEEAGTVEVRTRRSRTVSEIPKSEKDQIVNYVIAGFVLLLILAYFMS